MSDKSIMRPTVRTQFGGLNNNLAARDGEIVWMENMSSREYPLLTPRKPRAWVRSISKPYGLGARDALYWVSGTGFYYNGVLKGSVTEGDKQFAAMGQMICIFPDKKYYDIDGNTFGNLAVEVAGLTGVQFQNGTYAGVPATANTIYKAGAAWAFKAGDALTISGCTTHPENNKTAIVREVDGDYLRFYENTFTVRERPMYTVGTDGLAIDTYYKLVSDPESSTVIYAQFTTDEAMSLGDTITWNIDLMKMVANISGEEKQYSISLVETAEVPETLLVFADVAFDDYTEAGTLTIGREVPDMDYICVNENRLWGCKGDVIYASALGDPFNFNVFDGLSTDSWQSAVPDEGDFTACVSYGGYPIFFKEDSICKVQGDKPSNFQWTLSSRFGVKDGSSHSLAVAGETLFYLSRAGICAYQGGAPRVISDALGANTRWAEASGGSDGIRYYVSLTDYDESDVSGLYVFDTRYGVWHREDEINGAFAFCEESLYMVDMDTGKLWRMDGDTYYGSAEGTIEWQVKFADSDNFYETTDTASQNKKGPLRILIRATLANESTIAVKIKYDDGTTQLVGTLTGTSSEKKKSYILPLILRRCDHYRLSLDGEGDAVVYSVSIEKYSGSQFQGSSSVTLPNSSN
jgi:hypothetical protein